MLHNNPDCCNMNMYPCGGIVGTNTLYYACFNCGRKETIHEPFISVGYDNEVYGIAPTIGNRKYFKLYLN